MNKESIDYTSEEFWKNAPKDAEVLIDHTHFAKWDKAGIEFWWSTENNVWDSKIPGLSWSLQKYIDTNSFDIIRRPATFVKHTQESPVSTSDNWFVDGKCVEFPPVGEVVEILWDGETECLPASYEKVRIVAIDGDDIIYRCFVNDSIGNLSKAVLHSDEHPMFRPIKKEPTMQEKILEAWKAQGIDFAYDNEDTNFSFKVLVDFVVNNFDVKEKE